jgi:23S rRNA (guanosine2251-2'-O)-methyltransferase
MSAAGSGRRDPGPGGWTRSGKPRPGTGGQGRRRLAGRGPTPPAELRPGHPAQRRAAAAAVGGSGPQRDRHAQRIQHDPGGLRGPRDQRGARGSAEVVAGRNAVLESLRAAVPAVALHVGQRLDADDRISEAIRLAAGAGIPVVEAGRPEMDRMTAGAVHQGLALRIRGFDYAHPDDLPARAASAAEPALIVALDGITDPRNLGAVTRSVAAFGAHGVLIPQRRSAGVTAGAWKASAGALARVPVARAANLTAALAGFRRQGLFVVGLDAAGDTAIGDLELADRPLVLVLGSEGRGLSRLVASRCDLLARIPMSARAQSLNAGVAAGIALYEIAGRRAGQARAVIAGLPGPEPCQIAWPCHPRRVPAQTRPGRPWSTGYGRRAGLPARRWSRR